MNARPVTTDDQAMLLFGLRHSGGSPKDVEAAAKDSWPCNEAMEGGRPGPTCQAMPTRRARRCGCCRTRAALQVTDAAYRRGVQFLVKTRAKDGTWHVPSRAPKFQPYFESGFPYGHDQWISAAATARAVVVLAGSSARGRIGLHDGRRARTVDTIALAAPSRYRFRDCSPPHPNCRRHSGQPRRTSKYPCR